MVLSQQSRPQEQGAGGTHQYTEEWIHCPLASAPRERDKHGELTARQLLQLWGVGSRLLLLWVDLKQDGKKGDIQIVGTERGQGSRKRHLRKLRHGEKVWAQTVRALEASQGMARGRKTVCL